MKKNGAAPLLCVLCDEKNRKTTNTANLRPHRTSLCPPCAKVPAAPDSKYYFCIEEMKTLAHSCSQKMNEMFIINKQYV